MFTCSRKKSTLQAACESGLTTHTVLMVLHKELNFHPWKHHFVQELKIEDRDKRMEFRELILPWHEDWPQLFKNIM